MYDDEARRYIDIQFRQSEDNWYLSEADGRFKHTRVPAKKCEVSDFLGAFDDPDDRDPANVAEIKSLHAAWAGIAIFCPDLDKFQKGFALSGDPGAMKAKHMQFSLSMCDPKSKK